MCRLARNILVAVILLTVASPAAAQGTGGSFGSSGFGSSGSSGGSSGGSHGWSGGSSSSDHGSGSSRSSEPKSAASFVIPAPVAPARYLTEHDPIRTPAEVDASVGTSQWLCVASTFVFLIGFGVVFGYGTMAAGRDRSPFEVRQVSVAFDWTERRALQSELAALADAHGAGAGRGVVSGRAARMLAQACSAARYGAFQSFHLSEREAEAKHVSIAQSLRARYQRERAGARAIGDAPTIEARLDEGEGLVVVSMVVAWRSHMAPLPTRLDRATAAQAFETLLPGPSTDVVALEVVWSPADENDRMSSAELEALYPELVRLDAGADVGRVACGYCRAVYAAELGRCPACGGPRIGSAHLGGNP